MYSGKNIKRWVLVLFLLQPWNHAIGQGIEENGYEMKNISTANPLLLTDGSTSQTHEDSFRNGTDSTVNATIDSMVSGDLIHTSEDPTLRNATLSSTPDPTNQDSLILKLQMNFQYVHDMFLIPCLSPIGVIGNSIVAHTLVLKSKSNTSNRYMVTILITDVIGLIGDLFLPLASGLAQSDSWSIKEIAAQVYFYAADVLSFVCRRFNLNVFCVLSFERLIAITKPFEIKQSVTVNKFHWFLVASFLMAIVQTLPTALFKFEPVYNSIEDYTSLVVVERSDIPVSESMKILIGYVIHIIDGPAQILFFTIINVLIARAMAKRKKSAAVASGTNADAVSNHQKKLVKIFLILSVTNTLAFLTKPCAFFAYTLMEKPEDGRVSPYLMLVVSGSHFLKSLNSITDFIVFLAVSTEIRNDAKQFVKCKLRV